MPSDTTKPLGPGVAVAPHEMISKPNPFNPRVETPPRPTSRPEEGEAKGEGFAAVGSGLVILALAGLVAWMLYLALG
ncbi:hypothetical protein ACVFYP_27100 [Roseomonas sp. F4]